jgi:N-acetylmuramoyl-L-alanine amidase
MFDKIKDYFRAHQGEFVSLILGALIAMFLYFIINGKSIFVFLKNPNDKVKIEFYDFCSDTTGKEETFDLAKFVPKKIKYIAIHCTGTQGDVTIPQLEYQFFIVNKWKRVGYHYLVLTNGKILVLKRLNSNEHIDSNEIVNGVAGYNSITVSIAYAGGIDRRGRAKNTLTEAQKLSLKFLIDWVQINAPEAKVMGHRDFPNVSKACPSFDVKTVLR